MPWDSIHYPPAMANLPQFVRDKAIEIANALLAQHYDEGKCIRIAIAAARRWAQAQGWGASDPPP
jgi:uncharacterized protein YdaT